MAIAKLLHNIMKKEKKWDWIEMKLEEELVLKEGKFYMPKGKKLRVEIIQLYYDIPTAEYKR